MTDETREELEARLRAELRDTRRELEAAVKRFRDFAEAASDWFFELDENLRLVYMSEQYSQAIGAPVETMLGRTRREIAEEYGELDPSNPNAEALHRLLERLEARQAYAELRFANPFPGSAARWIATSGKPVHDADGRFLGYRGVGRDVTALVDAEARLRLSEQRHRDLEDVASDWVWESDAAGCFTFSSGWVSELMGLSPEDWIGLDFARVRTLVDVVFAGSEEEQAEYVAALRARVAFHRRPYQLCGGTPEERFLEVSGCPRYDENGAFAGYLGIGTDVTERRRAELALARHGEALEAMVAERTRDLEAAHAELLRAERLAAIGNLTATVSHELRNPLGTIRTTIESIRRDHDLSDQQSTRRLQRIDRSIDRCTRIIEDLLDFSRTRRLVMMRTAVDEWLAALLDEHPPPGGVVLELELTSGLTLEIDPERLRQALLNVPDNPYQAMSEPASRDENRLALGTRVTGDRLEIRIADTGVGIDRAALEHIFEPLFSTRAFGTGLGLPLVKRLLEEHGGGVEVASTRNVSTTFTLWLPAGG